MRDEFNRRLVRVSVDGWPAQETSWIGDWLVRLDEGISSRANSVVPLGEPGMDLSTAIEAVEALYTSRALPPMFQLYDGAPADLDPVLAARGYRKHSPSVYLIAESPTASGRADLGCRVLLETRVTDAWAAVWRMGRGARDANVRRKIFARIRPPCSFAVAWLSGRPVGIGHAAVTDQWAWFHGIQTVPEMRGHGVAGLVLDRLADWCRSEGADRFFLQVEHSNAAARRAYEKAGFSYAFDYWYRFSPADCGSDS